MAQARSLYRCLLRVGLAMPDLHRTNLVIFRTRAEFELARAFEPGSSQAANALAEGDIYLDNLTHQAAHLTRLSASHTLIPVNLRAPAGPAATASSAPRRRLLAAFQARAVANRPRKPAQGNGSRFMQGPEPSWVRKRREAEDGGAAEAALRPAAKAAAGGAARMHGHAQRHSHDGSCCS